MVPFQTAYAMIIVICFLILAGNTSFVSISPLDEIHSTNLSL